MDNETIFKLLTKSGKLTKNQLKDCWKQTYANPRFADHKDLSRVVVELELIEQEDMDAILGIETVKPDEQATLPIDRQSGVNTDVMMSKSRVNPSRPASQIEPAADKTLPLTSKGTSGTRLSERRRKLGTNLARKTPMSLKKTRIETASQSIVTDDLSEVSFGDLVENRIGQGKYTVENMLGQGGMGEVFMAREAGIKRELAFKVLKENLGRNSVSMLRFIEEAQITGQLEHPNIVPVHELGINADGQLAFTMKLVKGRSLKQIIEEEKQARKRGLEPEFSLVRKLDLFMKVLDAIAFAHSRDVIHRDLKPENVMVGEFGEVLVMDWGLAKVIGQKNFADDEIGRDIETVRDDMQMPELTMDGAYVGTPVFMSPEQAMGNVDEIDKKSDLFSLGALLYNLATLELPYKGKSVQEILLKASEADVIDPRKNSAFELPNELCAIILKAMSERKRDRYTTVNQFKADIEAFIENRKTLAYSDSAFEKLVKWSRRNPRKAISVFMSVFFVMALGVVAYVFTSQLAQSDRQKLDADRIASAQKQKAEAEGERAEAERKRAEAERKRAEETGKLLDEIDAKKKSIEAKAAELLAANIELEETISRERERFEAERQKILNPSTIASDAIRPLEEADKDEFESNNPSTNAKPSSNSSPRVPEHDDEADNKLKKDDKNTDSDSQGELPEEKARRQGQTTLKARIEVLMRGKRYAEAAKLLEEAIEKTETAEYLFMLASIQLYRLDDPEAALETWERIEELDPDFPGAFDNIDSLTRVINRTDDIDDEPTNAHFLDRAKHYARLSLYAKAIADYDHVLSDDKANLEALSGRAFARFESGLYAEALADYQAIQEINSDLVENSRTIRKNMRTCLKHTK